MATRKATPRSIVKGFSAPDRVTLAGSEKKPFKESFAAAESKPTRGGKITVSVVVRRKQPLNVKTLGKVVMTRSQYKQNHGADPADVKLVKNFAREFGLTVEKSSPKPERRTLHLSGSRSALEKAFGVKLGSESHEGTTYRVREGGIEIPSELAGVVVAVLGLDDRPQAKAHFRVARESGTGGNFIPHAGPGQSFTPVQIAQLYQFPAKPTASGQTIGLIELGGGYRPADITAYFKALGQTPPTVVAVSVDKGKNAPTTAQGADGEVMLDIEVAAAVAPGARIVVYFAPNTDQGFIDAIGTAVHDTANKPSVISISWGGPESSWTQQAMNALDAACQSAAALGITVTAAAGDDGSTDGVSDNGNHVDFPASSPHVLACGGTKLVGSGSTITSEVVWNELSNNEGATGGGVSATFTKPSWQSSANVPAPSGSSGGRGVPDVSGNADPATGYSIRVDGQNMVIGGTSAVAPLWAGLIAVANKQNGKAAGFINPKIYAAKAKSGFRDIISGNNPGFSAGPGWDACTGLGTPVATRLIPLLAGASSTSAGSKSAKASARGQVKRASKTPAKTAKKKTSR